MKYFVFLAIVLLLLAVFRWCFLPHGRLPRFRVRYLRMRLRLRLHPGRGHATAGELWLRWGRLAAFRRSARARRSVPVLLRLFCPDLHSLLLGRAQYGHALRVPVEEHLLIMAPPRTGKTGLLARLILRYPGPVVSTTTKADVFQLTSGVRSRIGPVHVFNPQCVGGVRSTFRWNPIDGCADEAVAIRRADGFANAVSMSGTEDASFWSTKASSYLRGLFHAAALSGGDMRLVVRWALGSAQDAEEILDRAGATQWALELAELRGEAQKTAATIKMVLSRALAFMNDPALARSVLPGDGDGFDIAGFLAASGTLYLIAASDHDDTPLAPLFAAMAGEIHHVAAMLGQASTGSRLDPSLLMALDEIVQVCPIPLPVWLADSGGKGVQLVPVAHGGPCRTSMTPSSASASSACRSAATGTPCEAPSSRTDGRCSPATSWPESTASLIVLAICCQTGSRTPGVTSSTGKPPCSVNGLPLQVTSEHLRRRA
jgi:type IV secretion system protein VirD4